MARSAPGAKEQQGDCKDNPAQVRRQCRSDHSLAISETYRHLPRVTLPVRRRGDSPVASFRHDFPCNT
jgi:hypothetical protein